MPLSVGRPSLPARVSTSSVSSRQQLSEVVDDVGAGERLRGILGKGVEVRRDVQTLKELRMLIQQDGLPIESDDGMNTHRPYVWSILLGVPPTAWETYASLISLGQSPSYSKIRQDTFRTLPTDPLFKRRVQESSLIRLLNAFDWTQRNEREEAGGKGDEVGYVQGMNVLAAPFLYMAKSETQAFALYSRFITHCCPAYVKPSLEGVHRGLRLLDICLSLIDPELSSYLRSKDLTAKIYGFASVLTLSASTPPLPEVLILWDFLLARGVHLNILCIIAQLVLIRNELLSSPSPGTLLRSFPPLQARKLIGLCFGFLHNFIRHEKELYRMLAMHTYDEEVGKEIDGLDAERWRPMAGK
ncbi:TBC-domain-containing protein [Saitoella complicata NRRL Y-17804]|uniref:Rab-GAP TBC domain-containing protein n=1 Tax=Saitoella complicata (strain BCRC 22490 / CBS 7301 / JCM 7358 / NBRC 10748 / NRRL Y-17804) TaxID=698492 RepID=A0A0E9NP57_SAICN|nr:TBC-domain-containing protein [Saitoella complicata NRRL Y-17804]ODQ52313.1 TBC-domain-containing protein [Saitoella complicata NRRL Y-17804]GAO51451.1 hypothetical protein G7K_5552-t1 [Saitoella complicata NRRL Y-17804]